MSRAPVIPLPPLSAVLGNVRHQALAAFTGLGWRPWGRAGGLDAERRRSLNLDLAVPDIALGSDAAIRAVAHVETDREGLVTLLEVVGTEPVEPPLVASTLLAAQAGEPRAEGDAAARAWIWGPESGSTAMVGGEPVRLWICAEQAYGDRLWLVATLVRRSVDDE
jgi:hypothetical protein